MANTNYTTPAIIKITWAKQSSHNLVSVFGIAKLGVSSYHLPRAGFNFTVWTPKPHKVCRAALPCGVEYLKLSEPNGVDGVLILFNVILKAGFMLATTLSFACFATVSIQHGCHTFLEERKCGQATGWGCAFWRELEA